MAISEQFTKIVEIIDTIFDDPEQKDNYINLARHISDWEDENARSGSLEARDICSYLQKLENHLSLNSFHTQSEQISRIIIQHFPELLFPELPKTERETVINLKPLKDARKVLKSQNFSEEIQEAFRLFEEQFKKAMNNLLAFSKDVELGHFRERGSGVPGELFRQLKIITLMIEDTQISSIPWELINQLALKINNDLGAYHPSYSILRNLSSIVTKRTPESIEAQIRRNRIFFQRNLLWDDLDKASQEKRYGKVVVIIDKLLPLVESASEKENLVLMKKNALEKVEGSSKGCLIIVIVLAILSGIVSMFDVKTLFRNDIINTKKTDSKDNQHKPEQTIKKQFKDSSGLIEEIPPLQPYDKPLTIPQIRYAVYQKERIEYLKGMSLSDSEQAKLKVLIDDWQKRCAFYKYNVKDREKIDFEVKNYKNFLILDTNEILASWRKKSIKQLVDKQLLNLSVPAYAKKVQTRLKKWGYFSGALNGIWDEESKRALKEFKVIHMGIVDSKWDFKTQKILFSK